MIWVFDRADGFSLAGDAPDGRPPAWRVRDAVAPAAESRSASPSSSCWDGDGNRLRVRGVDMLDGTPVLDIKPYLSSVAPDAIRRGWLAEAEARRKG